MLTTPSHARQQLWSRLQALMVERWGAENQNRLAREAKVGVATIARIKQADTSVGLDVLDKVACALSVESWQLLCPQEVLSSTVVYSPMAADLAKLLDRITNPQRQRKAYALAQQVMFFGLESDDDLAQQESSPDQSTRPAHLEPH